MNKATIALVLDQKKIQSPDMGIVKIRVTFQREKRFVTTGLKVSVADWQKLDRMKGELDNRIRNEEFIRLHQVLYGGKDERQRVIEGILPKARKVVDKLGANFSFEGFKNGLANYGKEDKQLAQRNNIFRALSDKQTALLSQSRIGTASMYGLVAKSISRFILSLTEKQRKGLNLVIGKQFAQQPSLKFDQITPAFLNAYEAWMLREGKAAQSLEGTSQPASATTVGIYCRHLRAVFNQAVEEGIITAKEYPFGRNRYLIPGGRNPKKALSKKDLNAIKNYQPNAENGEQRAHDLWLFTYYSNGLNMADLCRLRWRDIDQKANCFYFVRQKTRLTKKGDVVPVRVQLRPETWVIIERWASGKRSAEAYIFPFLNGVTDAKREKAIVAQVIKHTNKWMGRIAESLGIDSKLGTYSARHSFATTLLRNGASVAFIGQQVGHASVQSTEHYLGQFEEEDIQQFLNCL